MKCAVGATRWKITGCAIECAYFDKGAANVTLTAVGHNLRRVLG